MSGHRRVKVMSALDPKRHRPQQSCRFSSARERENMVADHAYSHSFRHHRVGTIRRIAAMFVFSMRIGVLAVAVSASSLSSAAAQSELLCSPEGLMRLIPQFNVNGQFTVPNSNSDLQTFLSAQQGLSNVIDMILAQENINQNSTNVGNLPSRPLIFGSNWLSSEVGIQTDGTNLNSPEAGGKFGGYRVRSFLSGLTPVPLSQGSIYVIKQSNPTYPALVYPMPTSHPCVNRLFLAAGDTAGFWPTPSYALADISWITMVSQCAI